MTLEDQVRRAVRWHQGELSEQETPASFEVHVGGPWPTPASEILFHTYAGLFPERNTYVAIRSGHRRPLRPVTAREMRDIVAAGDVSREDVRKQRKLVVQHGLARSGLVEWAAGVRQAVGLRLPVGFYAIGDNLNHERIVMFRSILSAPIGRAIDQFKKVNAQIMFP